MDIKKEKYEQLSYNFSVTLTANEIDIVVDSEITTQSSKINLPGFRPGKAPISILRKKFRAKVLPDVLRKLIDEAYKKALSDNNIRPAGEPRLDLGSYAGEGDLTFAMDIDCLPEITLQNFNKISTTKYNIAVKDRIIDEQLKQIAQPYRKTDEVNRKAKESDIAVIDFVGSIEGTEFDGGKAQNQPVEIGEGRFIPGFEDQLIGVKKGDKTTIHVKFPDDYGAAELAGKEAEFSVNVREIRSVTARDIDDELAKELGYDDVGKLREAVSEQAKSSYDNYTKQYMKKEILDQLDIQYDFEMPKNMIEREVEAIANETLEHNHNHGENHKHEMTDEQRNEFTVTATRRVKLGLVLAEIGREKNIDVTEQELNNALMQVAQNYPGQQQQVIEFYKNNQQAMFSLHAPIFEDKVIDALIQDISVTQKDITLDDFNILMNEDSTVSSTSKLTKKGQKKPANKKSSAKKSNTKKAKSKKS